MAKKRRNYGLKICFPQEGDYVLGSISGLPKKVLQPDGQWDAFLPLPEYQALGVETMACTVFGTLSACEIIVKKKFSNEKNFSDRWLAWNADISPSGADPHQTAETLRKAGVPYQEKWDYTADINTWDKFYETPPAKLFDYAKEDFYNPYLFQHEYVPTNVNAIKEALTYSPLGISVYAWIKDDAGVFYKPNGVMDNHWCVAYGWIEKEGKFLLKIFDSYDNTQKLYSGMPMIIKRFNLEQKGPKTLTWWDIIKGFFGVKKV